MPLFWFGRNGSTIGLALLGVGNYSIMTSPLLLWPSRKKKPARALTVAASLGAFATPLIFQFSEKLLVGGWLWLPINTLFLAGLVLIHRGSTS